MIYVFEDGNVVYDGSSIPEEYKKNAVAINELPVPEKVEGKIPIVKSSLVTNTVYYEYIDEITDYEEPIIVTTIEDYLLDLEFRLSMLELGF